MIKLYGAALSNNVNKVRYCLDYLELPYEFVSIDPMKGENQTAEFAKITPTRKIPALEDDGFTIFESNAIVRYLAKKERSAIYPQDIKKAAIVDAWIDFSSIHIGNAIGRITFNRVLAPMFKKEVDAKSLQFGLEMMDKYLPIMDKQLSLGKFITGTEFSIADIALLAALDPCEIARIDLTAYRDIVRWRNYLKAQDFYQKAFKDLNESLQLMRTEKTA
ncbi:MAG: glutathione S-transferase family protein [Candidatus Omnitrophota bacterium]